MKTRILVLGCMAAALVATSVLAADSAPTIVCSADQIIISPNSNAVEAVVSATVQDAEGDALLLVWSINGGAFLTNQLNAGDTTNALTLFITNSFDLGTNIVQASVTQDGSNFVDCSSIVLVEAQSAPLLVCSPDQELNCSNGLVAVTTATIQELDGQALHVEVFLNGETKDVFDLEADAATNALTFSFTNTFPVGTNIFAVVVTDEDSNVVQCATQVIMLDTTPPLIRCVKATPNLLWPVNHKLVSVCVRLTVDDCTDVSWRIANITCNERVNMRGSGHTSPDFYISGPHQALLRAERSGTGSGRIYTLCIVATDTSGNSSRTSVQVCVPHDQRPATKSAPPKAVVAPKAKTVVVAPAPAAKMTAAKANGNKGNSNGKGNGTGKDKSNNGGKKK